MTLSLTPATFGLDPAHEWLLELDFTDLFEGPDEELEELIETAPNQAAKAWLTGWVITRRLFSALAH